MSEWQPIETAPRDGTKILLFFDPDDYVFVARWYNDDWLTAWEHDSLTQYGDQPTHWMPLPPPPSETMER